MSNIVLVCQYNITLFDSLLDYYKFSTYFLLHAGLSHLLVSSQSCRTIQQHMGSKNEQQLTLLCGTHKLLHILNGGSVLFRFRVLYRTQTEEKKNGVGLGMRLIG